MEQTPSQTPRQLDGVTETPVGENARLVRVVGVLVAAALVLGVGALAVSWGLDTLNRRSNAPQTLDPVFAAESARVNAWHNAAGFFIAPVLEGLQGPAPTTEEEYRKVCRFLEPRAEALNRVAKAPNESIETLFRTWVTTLQAYVGGCGDVGTEVGRETLKAELARSAVVFNSFYQAVLPYLPVADETPTPSTTP